MSDKPPFRKKLNITTGGEVRSTRERDGTSVEFVGPQPPLTFDQTLSSDDVRPVFGFVAVPTDPPIAAVLLKINYATAMQGAAEVVQTPTLLLDLDQTRALHASLTAALSTLRNMAAPKPKASKKTRHH